MTTGSHDHDAASAARPGTDSTVDDWFGQSVQRDTELVEELLDDAEGDVDPGELEREFTSRAEGEQEQDARHGDQIDPDQGRSAYRDQADDQD